jgi:hypothetical protein
MASVTSVGGVFFRARDPDALKAWYATHLGIAQDDVLRAREGASLVFGSFRRDSDHFPPAQQFMEEEGAGSFAWIIYPEGNRVELWQPLEGW